MNGPYDSSNGKYIRWLKEGNIYDLSKESGSECNLDFNVCVENRVDASRDNTCTGDSGEYSMH